MKMQWLLRGSIILLIGAIAACSTPSTTPEASNTNATETTEVATKADPQETVRKVVALTSLTADLVQTLEEDVLVGMPGTSILQADERFAGLEVVSAPRTEPDLEKIVALEPDLVIGAIGFHDRALDRLQELDIETMAVDVNGWDSLKALTQDLAQKIDADPEPLLNRYDACLAQAPETAPTALVLVSRQPLLSPNQQSWAGDFLTQFNIKNVTADFQGESEFDGYITLSEEKVLTVDADMLLVVETEENVLAQLKGDAFWGELKATQNDAVHVFDYFGFINPGSIMSIEATCEKLAQL